jgi:hypothetical protein
MPMTQKSDKKRRRSRSASSSVAASVTWEEFSTAFDRCFTRVYAYVGRRVSDGASCERLVSEVLAENVDLLAGRGDERQEISQLKASSDRLIELESARPPIHSRDPRAGTSS